MLHYIIDGNNLIGKIDSLRRLQKNQKIEARHKIAIMLERYFANKKSKITLHFDGFINEEINVTSIKIVYSEKTTADSLIKQQIEKSKNPRRIILISSDIELQKFARACSCSVLSSNEFIQTLKNDSAQNEEDRRINELNNPEEFKNIFGV